MQRILDYNGQEAERTATVASMRALKGGQTLLAQVTTSNADEAAAARRGRYRDGRLPG